MISYEPLFDTLKKKGISEYTLIFTLGLPSATLFRIKNGKSINTPTLDKLCSILDCRVEDILQYQKEP